MSLAVAQASAFAMPWALGRDDTRRLQRWLLLCLALIGTIGGVIPWLSLPEVDRAQQEALPPQLARILQPPPEPVALPPPQPRIQEAPPPPEPEVAPQPRPEAPPQPRPEPQAAVTPAPSAAAAREVAAVSGLLAFRDAFADMRESVDVERLRDTGAIARGTGEAASLDRSVLTSARGTRSAGVDVAELSRDTGGVALSGRETTQVEAVAASSGQGGARDQRVADARQRSVEDIRRVFDANKGAIFTIYNRALRADPTLQGQLVLELVIAPSGQVTDVRVLESGLADADLVARILSRIRMFDFGQRDVGATRISYPVHFLPS